MSDDRRDIRDFLQAEADRAPQPTGITAATVRRARLKRAGFLTSSLLLVAILTGGIAFGFTSMGRDVPPVPPAQNEGTTPTDLNPRVTATIAVGRYPRAVEVLDGYVWVTVDDPGSEEGFALVRIDPQTNEVADSLPLKFATDLAVGAGAVWVVGYEDPSGARLLRIDPHSNSVVDTVRLDCVSDHEPPDCFPVNVAVEDTAVWVTLSSDPAISGEVVRVDPSSNEIVARIPIENGGPRDVVLGGDSVWVNVLSDAEDNVVQGASLLRIDPQTNEVADILLPNKLLLGGTEVPPVMTADESDVWVVKEESHGATVPSYVLAVRVDAQTGEITGESGNLVPKAMGRSFFPFATDRGGMWFYGRGDVAVHRLNSETMQVDESVHLRDQTGYAIDAVLDPAAGTIWIASYDGPVIRIDLR